MSIVIEQGNLSFGIDEDERSEFFFSEVDENQSNLMYSRAPMIGLQCEIYD